MSAKTKRIITKIGKWTGIVIGSILLIAIISATVIYIQWENDQNKKYSIADSELPIPETDSLILARGMKVANLHHCNGCHTLDFKGETFPTPSYFGSLSPANLTRGKGGIGSTYTDNDWVRAIRHGVRRDGTSLMVMPTEEFNKIGKEDLQALIAYIKSVPPVDHELPPNELKLFGRLMIRLTMDFNIFSASRIDHLAALSEVPAKDVSLAYGTYMVQTCKGCHGEDLHGEPIMGPSGVSSTNITALKDWSVKDFGNAVRQGVRPNGDSLLVNMPRWTMLDDTDIEAIYLYINEQKKFESIAASKP
jgi:mono/diheme cytochrome c family protein